MTDRKGYLSDTEIKRRCAEEFTPKGKKTYALFTNPMIPGMMLQRPKDPASLMEITSKVSGTTYEQQVENYIKGLRQIPNQSQEVLILRPRSDRAANTVRASRPMVQPVGTQTAMTSLRDSAVSPIFAPLTFTTTPPSGVRVPTPRLPMETEQSIEPQATPATPSSRVRPPSTSPRRTRMSSEQRAIREALESPTTAARILTTPEDVRVLRSRSVPRTPGASSSQETPQERLRRMVSSQEIIEFPGALSEDIDKDLIA